MNNANVFYTTNKDDNTKDEELIEIIKAGDE